MEGKQDRRDREQQEQNDRQRGEPPHVGQDGNDRGRHDGHDQDEEANEKHALRLPRCRKRDARRKASLRGRVPSGEDGSAAASREMQSLACHSRRFDVRARGGARAPPPSRAGSERTRPAGRRSRVAAAGAGSRVRARQRQPGTEPMLRPACRPVEGRPSCLGRVHFGLTRYGRPGQPREAFVCAGDAGPTSTDGGSSATPIGLSALRTGVSSR
jgi:hypothetical protein